VKVKGFAVAAEVRVKVTEGDEVTVYPVIVEPLFAPAVKGIEIVVLLVRVTIPIVCAAGAVAANGVIEFEAEGDEDVPTPFVAVIVNVYAWPWIKDPVTVSGEAVPE